MTKTVRFETEHLILRPWKIGDEDALLRYANNRRVSIWLRDRFPYPYTLKDAQEWIQFAGSAIPLMNFAVEVESQAVGGIGLMVGEDVFRRSAEIGYWLGEPYWGRGLMASAIQLVTEYGFRNLDLVRIYAGVFDGNSASVRVLEKAGYRFESRMEKAVFKEGRFFDQLMYVNVL